MAPSIQSCWPSLKATSFTIYMVLGFLHRIILTCLFFMISLQPRIIMHSWTRPRLEEGFSGLFICFCGGFFIGFMTDLCSYVWGWTKVEFALGLWQKPELVEVNFGCFSSEVGSVEFWAVLRLPQRLNFIPSEVKFLSCFRMNKGLFKDADQPLLWGLSCPSWGPSVYGIFSILLGLFLVIWNFLYSLQTVVAFHSRVWSSSKADCRLILTVLRPVLSTLL